MLACMSPGNIIIMQAGPGSLRGGGGWNDAGLPRGTGWDRAGLHGDVG